MIFVLAALLLVHACVATFDTAYDPTSSRHFDPAASSSFSPEVSFTFDLNYADSTHLHGFTAKEFVEFGQFRSRVPVGIITDCNSPDFNGVDGILGFGCEKHSQHLPTPLFWAMTDPTNLESNARHIQRKFSFFSSQTAAELQLGGYDPETVEGDLYFVPTSSPTDFIVDVSSLKFGDPSNPGAAVELLQFSQMYVNNQPAGTGAHLPAIMDSGTSCLVIPGSTLDGTLNDSPFALFAKNWGTGKSFWITINNRVFEMDFSSWFLSASNETCVQETPAGMNGLLVGDVFFRNWLVLFDMTQADHPMLGIGKLNRQYTPVTQAVSGFYTLEQAPLAKFPVKKRTSQQLSISMMPGVSEASSTEVDQIPVFNKKGTQYFVDLKMGTPPQQFTVIFDTGSSVFGVFVNKDKLPKLVRKELPSDMLGAEPVSLMSVAGGKSAASHYLGWDFNSVVFGLIILNVIAIGAIVYGVNNYLHRRRDPLSAQCRKSAAAIPV